VVCLSVRHDREPCKTAEPIDMPLRLWTRVGPRDHVLHGDLDLPWEGAILSVERGQL